MFVALISFPPIQSGKDAAFREWFVSSNRAFASFKGFVSRKLLKPQEAGAYAAIVEFEDEATFWAMHNSAVHAKFGEQVKPLFDGKPVPKFYEVITG